MIILNSYDLMSLSYIVGEDKSSEEPTGNRDEGVERVEVSARQGMNLSPSLLLFLSIYLYI